MLSHRSDEESDGDDDEEDPEDENGNEQDGEEQQLHDEEDAPVFKQEGQIDSDDEEGEEEELQQLRRSQRIRKRKQPLKIDFANRVYQERDGVLHINPTVLEASRESTKITSVILPKPTELAGRIHVASPRTAGISKQALARVSLGALGLPPLDESNDADIVEDHVVMHVLRVVLAEQYSINKAIRLFGEKAKESARKESTCT